MHEKAKDSGARDVRRPLVGRGVLPSVGGAAGIPLIDPNSARIVLIAVVIGIVIGMYIRYWRR